MATPSSNTASQPFTIVPKPIATGDQHVCFICLATDADEPNGDWVNPCPCSLEAHEPCMLQWIAETEHSSSTSRSQSMKCPVCKAPIRVEEPHDAVVAFRNSFHKHYSKATPMILLGLVTCGSVVGSAWYGWNAISVFAGPRAAYRWFNLRPTRGGAVLNAAFSSAIKLIELSAIGPAMVILWAVPGLEVSFVPVSVLYASALIARNDLPSWPPSPEWALTLMPYVHMTYDFLFSEIFGSLEKRLNRALRGRPPNNPPEAPVQAAPEGAVEGGGEAAPAQRQPGHEHLGTFALLVALTRAIRGIFRDPPAEEEGEQPAHEGEVQELQIDIRIGGAGDQVEEDEAGEEGAEEDEDTDEEDQDAPQNQPQAAQPPQPQPAPQPRLAPARGPPGDGVRREDQRRNNAPRPRRNNPPRQRRNNAPDPGANGDEPRYSLFSYLTNGIATTLLLPAISYGFGEIIRRAVPSSWVAHPGFRKPQTGLLQARWGRSLVGACLYFVLRDAFALYYKYRKVQVKQARRVRNVDRNNRQS
ncbi:hypothetical protein OQA88_12977 [Cercophora sp. LCS_1]